MKEIKPIYYVILIGIVLNVKRMTNDLFMDFGRLIAISFLFMSYFSAGGMKPAMSFKLLINKKNN